MKPQALFYAVLSLSLLGLSTLPAVADVPTMENRMATNSTTQATVIPQTAAVIVVFPSDITLDAGKKQDYPITLFLNQPIFDGNGNAIVPEKSPISARLKPTKNGIKIIADSVVIRGQIISLNAESSILPASTIKIASGTEKAKENSGVFSRLGASAGGAVSGGNLEGIKNGGLIGSAVGIFSGLTSSEKVKVVKIAQGSQHILTLQTAINLPFSISPTP
jgi:hypothetical protein